ncbi:hypothetical protein F4813DRAFT_341989 [Daldinia decipiens]|uniref:uncharacterized protein n=1 Tax=Daldinia decipiens TaxID=326647 RepID=UPI0020C3C848|nr:uncharacterized protein F4813DRAFT_341989 [Daldinia decipiens]KAI1662804.1 hypothetical protein F4813DRAFT_341989 [Daldinia decipiens]
MDLATIPFTILGDLKTVWDICKIVKELTGVPEASKVFVKILEQVSRDNEYARDFFNKIQSHRKDDHSQFQWIVEIITTNSHEISSVTDFMSRLDLSDSPNLHHRIEFVLKEEKTLNDQEKVFRFSQNRVLAAISTMHLLTFQPGPSSKSSLSSPAPKPLLRRASPVPPRCCPGTKDANSTLGQPGVVDEKVAEHVTITTIEGPGF